MKKAVVFGVCLMLAAPVFAQDTASIDYLRGLNEGFTQGSFWKSAMKNGSVPFFPGLYLSRKQATYVTFGILVNNEEPDDSLPDEVLQTAILLKAAFLVRRNKTNVILFFDYFKDGQWGLSLRLRY
jgi:hypothetical protein